ncbi:MAG: hypothetical protein ACKVOH_05690 [Chlamydiales bacterium]
MNIFGPQYNPPAHRIKPIDDRPDDQNGGERERRRSQHRGRTWGQRDKADL